MKIPFSYKRSYFTPMLSVAVVSHLAVLGVGNFWNATSTYNVRQADTSVDVVLVAEPFQRKIKEQKDIKVQKKILTTDQNVLEKENIINEQKKEQQINKQESDKQLAPTDEKQGARLEARPDTAQNPAPKYPRLARERGWEGTVVLKVHVSKTGLPLEVRIQKSSGYRVLDQAALKAVRKWQFHPARLGSAALPSWTEIPIEFILQRKA